MPKLRVNEKWDVTVAVYNNGTSNWGTVKVRFIPEISAPVFGTPPGTMTKSVNVPAGEFKSVTFVYTPTSLGVKKGYFVVDDGDPGTIDEIVNSLADNSVPYDYDVVSGLLPDLKANIIFSDSQIKTGENVTAEVVISNASGTASVEGQQVRVRFYPHAATPPNYSTPSSVSDQYATFDTDSLAYLEFTFPASTAGNKTAYVVIDSGDPGDIDESDDSITSNRAVRPYVVE